MASNAGELRIRIHKIKSIEDLEINLPVEKGLYAITGQNGCGKSTIVTCASRAFFKIDMNDYFGETANDSFIETEYDGIERRWYKDSGNEWQHSSNGKIQIKGFYEGSLIFGNRFRNTSYEKLKRVESVKQRLLQPAPDFIRENLGLILQRNKSFYEKMWFADGNSMGLRGGSIFFYEKGGKRVSQYHMSTGENLLISVLNSLNIRNEDRANLATPCMIFLDEIELALHPSSLKLLVSFLRRLSEEMNYAIYFSTHSIELISSIEPNKIFYIERYPDNSLEVVNPCYPAYATKFLYDHTGYDRVLLVEDDLAKEIISKIIRSKSLMDNKLVHIMPCGGWMNVMKLAEDVTRNNLLGVNAAVSVILDKDIEELSENYKNRDGVAKGINVGYLPVESLEKFLRSRLVVNVDAKLYRFLTNYVFQYRTLEDIIRDYQNEPRYNWSADNNGKTFYKLLETELKERDRNRGQLVSAVVDYLFDNSDQSIIETTSFLQNELK